MARRPPLAEFFAAALLAACAPAALAQAPAGPLPPKPGAPAQQAPEKPQIRVKVELVSAPVTVRNASGELVFDLTEHDFRIFDNGVEQKIEHFDLGGDPLSVVILMETSSRIEPFLPALRKTGILFTQTVLGASGEAAVLGFHDNIEQLLPFTSDADHIENTIAKLRPGTSGVRLYDALGEAVGLLRDRPRSRRRVVVALAEAVDTGSETRLGEVLREAQLSNVTIYTVSLSSTLAELKAPKQAGPPPITPPGTFPLPPMPGTPQTPTTEQHRHGNVNLLALAAWIVQHVSDAVRENALELASAATGGAHIATVRERSIENAIDQIGGELHAQYSLSYRPTGTEPFGYHEIKVEVARPAVRIRSRPGYYLPPPPTT